MELRLITIFLITYLVGCFCAAYYLVRWRTGQDIRTLYSGTAGARNAGRVLGKTGFIVSLAVDVLKGVCAVVIARGLLPDDHLAEMIALAGVMLGHVFPVQLSFRGGKGVSVLVGALLVIDPLVLVAVGLAAGLAVAIMRRTTQSTIIAMAVLPVAACWLSDSVATMTGLSLAAVLVLFFHRQNIHDIVSAYRNNKSG